MKINQGFSDWKRRISKHWNRLNVLEGLRIYGELDEAVNYQVISAKDLVDSVFTQGGWSNFLCSEKKLEQAVDVALFFIGRELRSSDVFSKRNSDPSLVNTLNRQRKKGWRVCCFQGFKTLAPTMWESTTSCS